jgi:hypothetical protein
VQREDTYSVYLRVDTIGDVGEFDSLDGGDADSEEKVYTANGGVLISLGGKQTIEPLTLERLYTEATHALYHRLVAVRGRVRAYVTKQPETPDGKPLGRSIVYGGVLKTVTGSKVDSESNEAAKLTVVVVPDTIS